MIYLWFKHCNAECDQWEYDQYSQIQVEELYLRVQKLKAADYIVKITLPAKIAQVTTMKVVPE